ncbi:MAG: GNAT family N-acetyltransferase [Actinobacteria bacterium]|nr:GNAT family N-acetyltransferase [Actinomycetota bacterium]
MEFELIEIAPDRVELLRDALIELHRHESAVQPTLGHAPARADDDYWRLYAARFAEWHASGNGFCLAAVADRENNDEALGFVFAVERQGDTAYDAGERIGYVEELAVLEQARHKGIGRALMAAAIERFRERGLASFKLSTVPGNDDARAFYSALGMAPAANLMIGRVDAVIDRAKGP